MTIKIGADPEFFLKKEDRIESAFGVIPGTKQNPFPVEKGAIQVDGMAVEFNIEPATSSEEFTLNIDTVLMKLREMVPKDFDFSLVASAEFTKEYLDQQPPQAKMLGCQPDYDAYSGNVNLPPDEESLLRTAAGHVHLGWTDNADIYSDAHFNKCVGITKQLDCILGLSSLLSDPDIKRRTMYGKAGAFRPKEYGVEYRVLSNYWLKDREAMVGVFRNCQVAFSDFENGIDYEKGLKSRGWDVQAIINNSDTDRAYPAIEDLYQKVMK